MPDAPRRPLAVFDIDGVLADVRHRLHHLERRPKNWAGFFAAAPDDPPLAAGLALAGRLAARCDIAYLTGRPESYRAQTEQWLAAHGLPLGPVHMRPAGMHLPAAVLKPRLLARLARRRTVELVVDDDPQVCAALTRRGWPVRRADWLPPAPVLIEGQEAEGRT